MNFLELQFTAHLQSNRDELPPFLGATLRGALGYLLKETVCQVAHGQCGRCLLRPACAYPAVFEGLPPENRDWMRKYPRIPQPFVLVVDPPREQRLSSSTIRWSVRLFGEACRYWPFVLHVFQVAGERGLGRARLHYELSSIQDGTTGEEITGPDGQLLREPAKSMVLDNPSELPGPCTLRWRLLTPMKLSDRQGHVSGLSIVLAGRRRWRVMSHFHGEADSPLSVGPRFESEEFSTIETRLRRYGFSRFSGRQQQSMDLSGLMGEIVIHGPWHKVPELLAAIPRIHLGKSTSFGFGRVHWEIV